LGYAGKQKQKRRGKQREQDARLAVGQHDMLQGAGVQEVERPLLRSFGQGVGGGIGGMARRLGDRGLPRLRGRAVAVCRRGVDCRGIAAGEGSGLDHGRYPRARSGVTARALAQV
jgi:hypothetical protein